MKGIIVIGLFSLIAVFAGFASTSSEVNCAPSFAQDGREGKVAELERRHDEALENLERHREQFMEKLDREHQRFMENIERQAEEFTEKLEREKERLMEKADEEREKIDDRFRHEMRSMEGRDGDEDGEEKEEHAPFHPPEGMENGDGPAPSPEVIGILEHLMNEVDMLKEEVARMKEEMRECKELCPTHREGGEGDHRRHMPSPQGMHRGGDGDDDDDDGEKEDGEHRMEPAQPPQGG